jgi:hypothetical protein
LAIEVRLYIAKILTGEIMRKELVEYAKTVYMDTPLDEIQKHVRDMDEFRYVFNMAQKNRRKNLEVFPFNNDKEVVVPEEIITIAREKFRGVDLDTLKTSTVQKELKCSYSIAWRVKGLLLRKKD